MSSELPMWYGQQRGIGFVELVPEEEQLPEKGGDNTIEASVLGTIVVAFFIFLSVAGIAAGGSPPGAVVLAGLLGGALVGWCLFASWKVASSEAPGGAAGVTVMVTAGIGRIVVITMIIGAILAVVAFIAIIITMLSSDRR